MRPDALMIRQLLFALAVFASVLPAGAQPLAAPEGATGRTAKPVASARSTMAVAANPIAAAAGRDVLLRGGSAVDAVIAMQFVLNVVEPQSSGIGGGGFMLVRDPVSGRLTSLDGREAAPAAARPDRFVRPDGSPVPFREAVPTGRAVGVPGIPRLLEEAHRRSGRLPWSELAAPAIRLAEDGFPVSPRLAGLLSRESLLQADPLAARIFFEPDGRPKQVGSMLRNPALAETLRRLARGGVADFYEGRIAEQILEAAAARSPSPSDMTPDDLRSYRVVERDPVCAPYRAYRVCGMGPPSSGGIAVLQILAFLEPHDLRAIGSGARASHLFTEAGRLAFADRNLWIADPDFVSVPVEGLLDRSYLRVRGATIDSGRSMGRAEAGDPPRRRGAVPALFASEESGTTHFAAVDRDGGVALVTSSIEDAFGARIMTSGGFLLNNQLTDFAFVPEAEGRPVANRPEGGKRPRSSMAPTLVFDREGRPVLAVGSAGGATIIGSVARTIVGVLDHGLDPQQAVDAGHAMSLNGPTLLERGTEAEAWKGELEAMGHAVVVTDITSGTQAIRIAPDGLSGGADGRREGAALGD
jgi:gamma-glutamyltranspeptidase/glutathione hydrolase